MVSFTAGHSELSPLCGQVGGGWSLPFPIRAYWLASYTYMPLYTAHGHRYNDSTVRTTVLPTYRYRNPNGPDIRSTRFVIASQSQPGVKLPSAPRCPNDNGAGENIAGLVFWMGA